MVLGSSPITGLNEPMHMYNFPFKISGFSGSTGEEDVVAVTITKV
jgi:hypothetical protein